MIDASRQKWLLVIPPEGAARTVGQSLSEAFLRHLGEGNAKSFDCKRYLDAYDSMLREPSAEIVVDLMNQSLIVQALDFGATHLLVTALSPITYFTTRLLSEHGVATLHWLVEDHRRVTYWKKVLPSYRFFLAIQKGEVQQACRERGVRFAYLPTAAARPDSRPLQHWRERPLDLAFVGLASPYRIRVLESLAAAGVGLAVAGSGWESYSGPLEPFIRGGGWTNPEHAGSLLHAARIGVHLSHDDPQGSPGDAHVSPRHFEVLQRECVLLAEASPLVSETLEGLDYLSFGRPEEAASLAREILAQPPDPATLRANREKVMRSHLYSTRARTILDLTAAG